MRLLSVLTMQMAAYNIYHELMKILKHMRLDMRLCAFLFACVCVCDRMCGVYAYVYFCLCMRAYPRASSAGL